MTRLLGLCDVMTSASLQGKAHGHAEVLKCLVRNYKGLNETCQTEMSRAVRMALWEYRKGMALTGLCSALLSDICFYLNPVFVGLSSEGRFLLHIVHFTKQTLWQYTVHFSMLCGCSYEKEDSK